jgi:biotin operon repressor
MTLIEALDELRFADLTLPIGAPSLLRSVAQWQRDDPESLKQLYRVAGMPTPLDEAAPARAAEDVPVLPGSINMPVAGAAPVRVFQALSDGTFHASADLCRELGMDRTRLNVAVARLRSRKAQISSLKHRGRFGYQMRNEI